jgi:ABC-2 type transport system permease protein
MIARLTARQVGRPAAVWGGVFALYLAASAVGYGQTYQTATQRAALAATLGSNAGINAVLGPAHRIDTVGGFVEWRALGVLGMVGAVWGLLTGTRMLRGEEEIGRWELLLAGPTTRRGATAEVLAGLAAGFALLWAVPALAIAVVGTSATVRFSIGSSLLLALASVASAAVFLVVGTLAAQLAPTRRQAAAGAGGVLGVAFALRAIADSGVGLAWLRWLTPLGWPEQLHPLSGARLVPLLPVAATVATLAGLTVWLAGRRDLGASTLPDRSRARPATRLLGGTTGLTIRLARPLATGWLVAVVLAGLLFGVIAKSAGLALQDSGGFRDALNRLGARGTGAYAYLGVAFLIVALLVALTPAAGIAALRSEEADNRLDHLLARPVARTTWLLGRIGNAVALLCLCGLLAALAAWLAAATQHSGVGVVLMLQAGVNVVPVALLVLGVGVLVFGVRPRAASGACYGLIAWSFLVQIIGSIVGANHWLLDTSLFQHMAAAPAVAPDWTAAAIMTGLGVVTGAIGVNRFAHRDLIGE